MPFTKDSNKNPIILNKKCKYSITSGFSDLWRKSWFGENHDLERVNYWKIKLIYICFYCAHNINLGWIG